VTYSWCYRLTWGLSLLLMLGLPLAAGAQQPSMSDSLWKYERNPEYFKKDLPFLDAIESHIIIDPQAMVAALLSKRIYWSDAFPHANMDRDLTKSTAQQNPNIIATSNPQVVQQLLKKINVNIEFEPMLFAQLRANEVSGNYALSSLGAALVGSPGVASCQIAHG